MPTLIEKFLLYRQNIDLGERFTYEFDINTNLFTPQEQAVLNNAKNNFFRNVKLKELIKRKANGSYEETALNFWIINEWGGIKTFKKNEENIKKIKRYSDQLSERKLKKDNFNTISSLSKISSFIDPDNYVIYDARVIYALNWLILTTTNDLKFFPMPSSRNKKLTDFDLSTIINLIHVDKYNQNVNLYYDYRTAYFKFCDLIKSLSVAIFEDPTIKPYNLEMLLFVTADKEVSEEIIRLTRIEILNEQ